MTEQRRLILEALRSTTCHPTADWIYERVREKLPHISLGTIYRNLRTLVQMGEIMQLDYGSGQDRFDGNPEPHYHFRCCQCGAVSDVEIPYAHEFDVKAAPHCSGTITGHRLEFVGECNQCKTNRQEEAEVNEMALFKCTNCGHEREARCKPRKCPECQSQNSYEKVEQK
ncbi:MAG: transcriptional repressor [Firmicutes bacterium]|nr:transcriptional repressor [Bacillota bacterium]